MKTSWILAGLLLCSAFSVAQDSETGNVETGSELLATCTRAQDTATTLQDSIVINWDYGACYGFVHAVTQILRSGGRICGPEKVAYGQVKKIVLKYLNDHPERLHLPSAHLVTEALTGAFPCATPAKPQEN